MKVSVNLNIREMPHNIIIIIIIKWVYDKRHNEFKRPKIEVKEHPQGEGAGEAQEYYLPLISSL